MDYVPCISLDKSLSLYMFMSVCVVHCVRLQVCVPACVPETRCRLCWWCNRQLPPLQWKSGSPNIKNYIFNLNFVNLIFNGVNVLEKGDSNSKPTFIWNLPSYVRGGWPGQWCNWCSLHNVSTRKAIQKQHLENSLEPGVLQQGGMVRRVGDPKNVF